MVAVAYGRWLLTRGFKYNDLTWKLLVFWKTGRRWGEVVAYERWSRPEVRLYFSWVKELSNRRSTVSTKLLKKVDESWGGDVVLKRWALQMVFVYKDLWEVASARAFTRTHARLTTGAYCTAASWSVWCVNLVRGNLKLTVSFIFLRIPGTRIGNLS